MDIIEEAYNYVKERFQNTQNDALPYHNWEHTDHVFKVVKDMIKADPDISKEEAKYVELAAIFHDIGYLETFNDHEERGAEIATEFLEKRKASSTLRQEVKQLILATKLSHVPQNKLENIIIDADLSHLGKEDYLETSFEDLRKEIKQCSPRKLSKKEWIESCISFLSSHNYLTEYARETFGKGKMHNISRLKEMLAQAIEKEKKREEEKVTPHKQGQKNPLKGVETMFKIALRNHVDLSAIADKKANTLISVNAIIISIVLSALFPKLDSNPFLFYPSVTILVGSFFTIILAILSTIPKVTRGEVSKDDVMNRKGNLLFFGNFHEMNLNDYLWSVEQLMESKDYIYSSMTRDLYFLGKVLNKKYILLRWSYYVFMLGLLLSIIIFVFKIVPYIGTTSDIEFQGIGIF